MMDSSKTAERRRNSGVSKASQRSEKTRKRRPRKMSPDSSSTRDTHRHRSSGKRANLKRKRGRSRSSDSNARPPRSRKRQSSRYADEVKNKRNVKKRRKEEIRRRVTGSKRRYRSISISSTSSDSSSSYSSQSCSTCSSYSTSSRSRQKRLVKTQNRSKKCLSRSAYSNERKQRVTNMELEKKRSTTFVNDSDVPGFRNPNGKLCRHDSKLSDCMNVDYSLELDKPRKRQRNHEEEGNGLLVHAKSKKQLDINDSYNDENLLGKPFSCFEKSKEEERVPDDAKSKAEALEFLLRQKALENLKRFRDCEFGMAGAPSPKKVEPMVRLGSREDDRVVFSGRFEDNRKCGKQEVDRAASNKHSEDSTRGYEQPMEASSEREKNSADPDKTTVIDRESTKHSEDGRRDYEESMEALSKKGKNRAYREMNLVRIKSSCPEETCTSSIATSQRAVTSDLCAAYADVNGTDASEICIAESRRKSSQYEGDKSAAVVDKGSKVAFVSLNKEHAWENEMSGSEKPIVKKSDDRSLETEFVSDKPAPKISGLPLIRNQNFQAGIVKADEESTEDPKPVTSQIEKIKSDDSTAKKSENSSFQQKTMSVMRGGEMVQVSYKVYIPQRAATLSKRQLQR